MDREDRTKQLIVDMIGTFDTPEGKRALEELSHFCTEHAPTYKAGDTHGSAFQEGARSVILYIRKIMAKDPNKVKQEIAKD
jgi:hypothetical protein